MIQSSMRGINEREKGTGSQDSEGHVTPGSNSLGSFSIDKATNSDFHWLNDAKIRLLHEQHAL